MKLIKALRSDRYADPRGPWLPHTILVEGDEVSLDDEVADRIIELDGALEVVDEVEAPEPDGIEGGWADEKPETKVEKGTVIKKGGKKS